MEKTKILIVEDEAITALNIGSKLKEFGYAVPKAVDSGERALEEVEKHKPDLVLMDIKLSGKLDGIEAAHRIHSKFNIPVIYLTAYADEEILERAKVTQPFGYLIKPIDGLELHSNIRMSLYKKENEKKHWEAPSKIKYLKDYLPICSYCKSVRDDKGRWNCIEKYLGDRSEIEFTHGICPDCMKKRFPSLKG